MSHELNGNGCARESVERLVIVCVEETIEPKLTARVGARYESPPQTREQAMTLMRLLLGCAGDPPNDQERWMAPIAGGRRMVTLTEEPRR